MGEAKEDLVGRNLVSVTIETANLGGSFEWRKVGWRQKNLDPQLHELPLTPGTVQYEYEYKYQTHGAAGAEGVSFGIIFDPYPRDRILDFSRTSTNCSSSHGIKPSSSAGTVYSVKILFDRNPMHTAGVFCFRIYSWRHLQYDTGIRWLPQSFWSPVSG